MQREIKFRAWDKIGKGFINGFNMIGFSAGQGSPNKKLQRFSNYWDIGNVELTQFTGLHDKNGKEIYEGDIFNMGDKNIRYSVVWHDNGFMGRQFHCLGSYCGLTYFNSSIEVMGNIHEHIELLEVSE